MTEYLILCLKRKLWWEKDNYTKNIKLAKRYTEAEADIVLKNSNRHEVKAVAIPVYLVE